MMNIDHAASNEALAKDFQFSPVFQSNPFLSDEVLKKYQSEDHFIYNVFYEDLFTMSVEEYSRETDSRHFDSSDRFARGFNFVKKSFTNTQSYTEVLVEGLQSQIAACRELINYDPKSSIDLKSSLPLFIKHAPFMYILSAVNAAIAIDRDRTFKSNDFFDMMHSCAGIGYTDFFFTERKFHHLLSSRPIDVASHFNVKLGSDPDEILNLLNEIH